MKRINKINIFNEIVSSNNFWIFRILLFIYLFFKIRTPKLKVITEYPNFNRILLLKKIIFEIFKYRKTDKSNSTIEKVKNVIIVLAKHFSEFSLKYNL